MPAERRVTAVSELPARRSVGRAQRTTSRAPNAVCRLRQPSARRCSHSVRARALTVGRVPGIKDNRAAVFASRPQEVEIYERGAWWPGKLLGWRHDAAGTCQVWVRVEFAGVVEDAWVDLSLLRLPEARSERHMPMPVGPPAGAPGRRAARGVSVDTARGEAADRHVDIDDARTQNLSLVHAGVDTPSAGRPLVSSGGRRRAPEPLDEVAGSARPARSARSIESTTSLGPVPGRHRAPADPGRHRAADTGFLTAVPAATGPSFADAALSWEPPPPRSELPPPGPVVRPASGRPGMEVDGLTRPMRLEDSVGSSRFRAGAR
jgi:hypothetical protein